MLTDQEITNIIEDLETLCCLSFHKKQYQQALLIWDALWLAIRKKILPSASSLTFIESHLCKPIISSLIKSQGNQNLIIKLLQPALYWRSQIALFYNANKNIEKQKFDLLSAVQTKNKTIKNNGKKEIPTQNVLSAIKKPGATNYYDVFFSTSQNNYRLKISFFIKESSHIRTVFFMKNTLEY